ncbi:MAG TPA: phage holin family protein [Polyangiaceae bacterium]
MNAPTTSVEFPETPADPVRQAIADARELVVMEMRLAIAEARSDLRQAKAAAIVAVIALILALFSSIALLVALILALGGTPGVSLLVAAVLFVAAGAFGVYAYTTLPKKILERTRNRLMSDVSYLKERVV